MLRNDLGGDASSVLQGLGSKGGAGCWKLSPCGPHVPQHFCASLGALLPAGSRAPGKDEGRASPIACPVHWDWLQGVCVRAALLRSCHGPQVERGCARVTCRKEGIHPEVHKEASVYCNGELVMTTQGTKKEYVVDVWSGAASPHSATGNHQQLRVCHVWLLGLGVRSEM